MASLEEIPLKFGQIMQLQLLRLDQSRLYARLMGYLANQAVLVTMPSTTDSVLPMAEGEAFVCRGFAGRVAFGFQTRITRVALAPFPHLFLTYPKEVESVVVRKTTRVAIQREAALLKTTEQGEVREPAIVVDISAAGTCAVAKAEFAAVKDSLTLLLPGGAADEPEIRLGVIVRSARAGDNGPANGPACQYGLEFVDLSPEQTRAVEKLMHEQLTRGL
ncbi:MAG TPA: flagellar brake protein [Steroidobacteraceae bacterium]|nr:flagellar brake protein [Steroidobacteraceae bacterium]